MSVKNNEEKSAASPTANDRESPGSSSSAVAVLGSLHLDIMVYTPDRPRKGETLPGNAWMLRQAAGRNEAVAAAQVGAQAFMIGRVGDDDFGKRLLSHLRSANVDTKHVRTDPDASSGMSVAIIDAEGDYGAVIVSGRTCGLPRKKRPRSAGRRATCKCSCASKRDS